MENIAKSNPKPTVIVHGDGSDQQLAKSIWALLAGHEIRFVSTKTNDELMREALKATLIIMSMKTPGDDPCQTAMMVAGNSYITADIMGFCPNASVHDRVQFLTYGFDYAFNDEFAKFPEFRQVLLKKIEKGRLRLDTKIQEEEYRRFKASLGASPDAFIVFDQDKKIFFVSHHYKRAYPRSANKLTRGLDVLEAFEMLSQEQGVSPSDPRYIEMKGFWESLEGIREFDLGDGRIWRMKAAKLDEEQGTIVTTTDITVYRKQKHELEALSKELGDALNKEQEYSGLQKQFVNMVSHEFRTPLTIIDGHAQILNRKADEISADDIRNRSKTIRSAVSRLVSMMEGVLSSNLLKTGKLQIICETIDLKALVRDLCDDHRELAKNYDIVIDMQNVPEIVSVDKKVISLIISNLLSNAIKYTRDNPKIIVKIDVSTDWLTIRVKDNGIGIPYDELPRIFERYFRASTATGIPGTGIGLSLVKDLTEAYQGRLEVNSVVSQGTEFIIYLPTNGPAGEGNSQ